MEKNIDVMLPLLENGEETLEVGVNGTMYIIKRGKKVKVTPEVYEVLKNAGLTGDSE